MRARFRVRTAAIAGVLVLVAACSTPQPIRALAEQGAATTGLAEAALRDYLATANAQLEARMDLLRYEAEQLAIDRSNREADLALDRRAGVPATDAAAKLMKSLAEDRRKAREELAKNLAQLSDEVKLDPASLAKVPSEQLAAARKSFSVLAEELSPEEWVKLYVGYAQEIKKSIDDGKKGAADGTTP